MSRQLHNLAGLMVAPMLSVGLLAGILLENRTHLKPTDVEPYHARCRAALAGIPSVIGYWAGSDKDLPTAAQKLLKPNAVLNRLYIEDDPRRPASRRRSAELVIVQCRDSRDMLGHFPPVCYVTNGHTKISEHERDWKIGDFEIRGMEYHFEWRRRDGLVLRSCVYNFLIVPGQGIVRDMTGISSAAEDYQQRYYGAAQYQVVTSGELSQPERDAIFALLMEKNIPTIETILDTKGHAIATADADAPAVVVVGDTQ